MARFSKPESVKLNISQGDWLLVKKRLTAGEQRRVYTRLIKRMVSGEPTELDPTLVGITTILGYLLDWSIKDAANNPIAVTDQTVIDALSNMDGESFNEILQAVQDHEKAMADEREVEKNVPAGESTSSAI